MVDQNCSPHDQTMIKKLKSKKKDYGPTILFKGMPLMTGRSLLTLKDTTKNTLLLNYYYY
jgi:hypothetical protein